MFPNPVDLTQLLEGLGEAVLCTDVAGRIVWANRAAASLLGRPRDTLPGLPVGTVAPALARPPEGPDRSAGFRPAQLVRGDGSRLAVEAFPSSAGSDAQAWALRPVASAAEAASRARLHQLGRIGSLFAESRPLDEAIRRALELTVELLGDWALLLRNSSSAGLETAFLFHRDPARLADLRRFVGAGGSVPAVPEIGAALAAGRPVLLGPLTRLPRTPGDEGWRAAAARAGARTGVAVPLRSPGGVLGALVVGAGEAGADFGEEELLLAQQVADRIGAGLDREDLQARLAHEGERLAGILDELPEAVVLRDGNGLGFANVAARALIGEADPHGWPFERLLSTLEGRELPQDELPLRRAAAGRSTAQAEYVLHRGTGRETTVLVNAAPISDARGEVGGAVAVFQDVGALRERERLELLLSEVSRRLLEYTGPDETEPLRRIAATVGAELDEWCAFSLIRADGSLERVAVAHPDPARHALEERLQAALPLRRCEGMPGADALRTGRASVLDPADPASGPAELLAVLRDLGVTAAMLVPLRSEGAPLGVFALAATGPRGRRHGPALLQFACALADRATLAVRNARLTRALERERDLLVASRDDAHAASGTLEAILRHAPVGIGHVDRELRFVHVNDALARLARRPAAELVGRKVVAALGPTLPVAVGDLRAALESGKPILRRELEVEDEDGEPRFHDLACHPVRNGRDLALGVTLIVVDQTAQVRARRRIAELAAEEHRRAAELTAVLDSDPNAVALFGADGRLRYASPRFGDLLRTPPHEAVGRHFAEVFEGCRRELHDPAGLLARTHEYFADRTRTFTEDVEFEAPERRYYRTTTAPVNGAGGAYLGRIFVFVDVTRDRELDRQRSDFLSVASHELKTPLTPLSINLQSLERKLLRGHAVDPALVQKSRRQVARLTALIEYLLDLSRLESGRLDLSREPISLTELVEEVVGDFRGSTSLHELACHVPTDPLIVHGDRSRLEQVLVNVVQNAIKYSPRGGRVAVIVERRGDEARVAVTDEGIGIPAEEQTRLFERFFRARNAASRNFGGLGIGLFVSHQIVERHGGRFEVESAPGRGSTFRFVLPVAPGTAAAARPLPSAAPLLEAARRARRHDELERPHSASSRNS